MRRLVVAGLMAALAVWTLATNFIARCWTHAFAGAFSQFQAVTKETVEGSFATRTTLTWLFEIPLPLLGSNCYVGSRSKPEGGVQDQIRPVSFNARTRLDICLA
ncbi:MAG TPA: hypothetical protein VMS11_11735 [Solirubrobacterales bacterium]|nr:hypothetical protein [Solirubrobacterales bacterium]